MSTKPVQAPQDLGASGAKLWRSMARQWSGDNLAPDARERRLLADACAEADVLAGTRVPNWWLQWPKTG